MDMNSSIISKEVLDMMDMFDNLDGQKKLEFLGVLLEKMENGEIELGGKPVYPEEIGMEDAYGCYASILDMVCKY